MVRIFLNSVYFLTIAQFYLGGAFLEICLNTPSYENVKRSRRLSGPRRLKEDTICSFAASLVREYLLKQGLTSTVETFDRERQERSEKVKYVDSTEAWYQASRAINLPGLCRYAADPAYGGKDADSAIEVCIRYLIDKREGGEAAAKREYSHFQAVRFAGGLKMPIKSSHG